MDSIVYNSDLDEVARTARFNAQQEGVRNVRNDPEGDSVDSPAYPPFGRECVGNSTCRGLVVGE